jgi:3-oxoacid CoA-transferase subunit A
MMFWWTQSGFDDIIVQVDKSTEIWLDDIEDRLDYDQWYCGHYHTDKVWGKVRFVFSDFLEFK